MNRGAIMLSETNKYRKTKSVPALRVGFRRVDPKSLAEAELGVRMGRWGETGQQGQSYSEVGE